MGHGLKDFEEMEVWQDARRLAVDVYSDFSQVKDFPSVIRLSGQSYPYPIILPRGAAGLPKLNLLDF